MRSAGPFPSVCADRSRVLSREGQGVRGGGIEGCERLCPGLRRRVPALIHFINFARLLVHGEGEDDGEPVILLILPRARLRAVLPMEAVDGVAEIFLVRAGGRILGKRFGIIAVDVHERRFQRGGEPVKRLLVGQRHPAVVVKPDRPRGGIETGYLVPVQHFRIRPVPQLRKE